MSLVHLNLESQALGTNTELSIILPKCPETEDPKKFYASGKKYKVLWLLHGTYGDHTDWIRRSMIETHVRKKDVIVVCPSALNTNYSNWPAFATGFNMYDFFFDELMPFVYNWLPASDKREDNFIAGLSMGGSGACLFGFNHPEKFGGIACLSSCPKDLNESKKENSRFWPRARKSMINYENEEEFLNGYENTMQLLRKLVKDGVELPKLFFGCGEEDELLWEDFKKFREVAQNELKLDAMWHTLPGYRHEWPYWDIAIREAIKYFGIIPIDVKDTSFR